MNERTLRISLIGCGQIADAHLQEIHKIAGVELLAVCDRLRPLAQQAAARFGAAGACTELSELLDKFKPDVLHITTPPQTHRAIALAAIQRGVHVYIEKPFAVDAAEAGQILSAAESAGVKSCVGHDQLFDPIWLELKQDSQRGFLGDIVHIESIQGYDLKGAFGRVLMEKPDHWVHHLPGGLFQNTMSHALYRITDFLPDPEPSIRADWRDACNAGFPTDLRCSLWGQKISANLVFTSQARPVQRIARIFGSKQIAEVDLDAQIIRRFSATKMPGAFARLEAPARQWREATRALARNIERFLRSEIHYFAGMRDLFTRFYDSIRNGTDSPISPREIMRVTALMDSIFAQCRNEKSHTVSSPTIRLAGVSS